MPEPQPDGTRPAADRPVSGPPAKDPPSAGQPPEDGPASQRPQAPAGQPQAAAEPTRAAAEPTSAAPDAGEPTTAELADDGPAPGGNPSTPPTRAEAGRWSGSAAVPPPRPKNKRWGRQEQPAPPPRDPTLILPAEEEPDALPPVDPWADADSDPWGMHVGHPPQPLPPTLPYPAPPSTRPYPAPPVAPHSPAPPVAPHSPAPPVAPYSPAPHSPAGPLAPYSPAPHVPAPRSPAHPPQPPPAPPSAPAKRRRGGRPSRPPVAAPPPGWRPPPGYVAVPVRRRRKWPWVLLLFAFCCCGVPAYLGQPMWEQYPAQATMPDQVADLRLRDDAAAQVATRQLETQARTANLLAEDTFAGIYTSRGKRVTVFGVTGFRLSPESDAQAEINRVTTEYGLTDVRAIDTGVRGEYRHCGVGRAEGQTVVVCVWADHGSLATALFTRLSVADSSRLTGTLRDEIITRG